MPHQCVRCSKFYTDGSQEILTGCTCGAKLFFYISQAKLDRLKTKNEKPVSLSADEAKQVEKDVYDIMGTTDQDLPIVLDLESVNISKPGSFELDLVQLFDKKQPLVYRLEEGRYRIDLPNSFRERRK